MVRVRLSRGGGKKRPYYHIVVVDQKDKRDGKCIERIGSYDPNLESEKRITLKHDRLDHWIKLGAQMSSRVKLLQKYTLDPDNLEKRQKIKSALLDKIKPAEDYETKYRKSRDIKFCWHSLYSLVKEIKNGYHSITVKIDENKESFMKKLNSFIELNIFKIIQMYECQMGSVYFLLH